MCLSVKHPFFVPRYYPFGASKFVPLSYVSTHWLGVWPWLHGVEQQKSHLSYSRDNHKSHTLLRFLACMCVQEWHIPERCAFLQLSFSALVFWSGYIQQQAKLYLTKQNSGFVKPWILYHRCQTIFRSVRGLVPVPLVHRSGYLDHRPFTSVNVTYTWVKHGTFACPAYTKIFSTWMTPHVSLVYSHSFILKEWTLLEVMALFYNEKKTRKLPTPVRIYCARWKHQYGYHITPTINVGTLNLILSLNEQQNDQNRPVVTTTYLAFFSLEERILHGHIRTSLPSG
jgi:hypothetical protein